MMEKCKIIIIIFIIIFAGFSSMIVKMKSYKNLYSDQGYDLRRYLNTYVSERFGVKIASNDYLSNMTGVSEKTLSNYLNGQTPINKKFLLYLVFGLTMDQIEAFALFAFFGFNKDCLRYRPYCEFYSLIGTIPDMDGISPKEYVDYIIRKSEKEYDNAKNNAKK